MDPKELTLYTLLCQKAFSPILDDNRSVWIHFIALVHKDYLTSGNINQDTKGKMVYFSRMKCNNIELASDKLVENGHSNCL